MDDILENFYFEVRTTKGELYKKNSFFALRHGLKRHMEDKGQLYDIVNGPGFPKSILAFKSMVAKLKEEGKGGTDHYPPVEGADLKKLYQYVCSDVESRERLQEKVFVDLMLYFGRRGRENIRDLKICDFWLTTDAEGAKYIYIKNDEKTKNHQEDENTAKGHMFERKDSYFCPVKTFVRYKKMLNPECSYLFQRVNSEKNTFDKAPIGHNKLGTMMQTLSKKAGLSLIYTNHSLRATTVHMLDEAQIPGRHICSVTGHMAETSLKTYTGYTSKETKKRMSETITEGCLPNVPKKICPSTAQPAPVEHQDENDLLMLSDDEFDELIGGLDQFVNQQPIVPCQPVVQHVSRQPIVPQVPQVPRVPEAPLRPLNSNIPTFFQNLQANVSQPLSLPNITGSNATVNININIYQK